MNSSPVPVLHVITMLELGGAQQNTLHTVAHLDRERFTPQLACGPGGMLDAEARALPDVPVHFIPELQRPIHPGRDWRATSALRRLMLELARGGPLIVHTHSSKAGVVGRWAAHRAGVGPVVHSIHGFGYGALPNPWVRRATLAFERRLARHTDAFISVSHRNEREARDLGLLGAAPSRVVRSGIDLAAFACADGLRADARRGLGLPADAPVVGMIACLKHQKAPVDFVDLAAAVHAQRPDTRFFIAGDGELRPAVERRRSELGLDEQLTLLGWRRDVPALLGALDVLVLTSRWEGLPRVCPQAMAAGRPVVATAVDGTPEAIVDGRNGYLFEPGDVATGAQRVLSLLADAELRAAFGRAGRGAVEEFDQDRMVADQERLYGELLALRRSG